MHGTERRRSCPASREPRYDELESKAIAISEPVVASLAGMDETEVVE
jgi:hypothetical protein